MLAGCRWVKPPSHAGLTSWWGGWSLVVHTRSRRLGSGGSNQVRVCGNHSRWSQLSCRSRVSHGQAPRATFSTSRWPLPLPPAIWFTCLDPHLLSSLISSLLLLFSCFSYILSFCLLSSPPLLSSPILLLSSPLLSSSPASLISSSAVFFPTSIVSPST